MPMGSLMSVSQVTNSKKHYKVRHRKQMDSGAGANLHQGEVLPASPLQDPQPSVTPELQVARPRGPGPVPWAPSLTPAQSRASRLRPHLWEGSSSPPGSTAAGGGHSTGTRAAEATRSQPTRDSRGHHHCQAEQTERSHSAPPPPGPCQAH